MAAKPTPFSLHVNDDVLADLRGTCPVKLLEEGFVADAARVEILRRHQRASTCRGIDVAKHVLDVGAFQQRFGIDDRLTKVSDALEAMPAELSRYGLKPGGGFVWRPIAGTDRLSVHSFGAAFDINVGFSDYWYNNRNRSDPKAHIPFKNRIPLEIVELFEKNGFIWGGRWYHYDTMHFEYRPELLLYKKSG